MNALQSQHFTDANPQVLTSANSPEIAERIKRISAAIMQENHDLSKRLENK